jgi:shikimate dehydrogenase
VPANLVVTGGEDERFLYEHHRNPHSQTGILAAVEMALAGAARISLVNRDRRRGEELARLLDDKTPATATWIPWTKQFRVPSEADIVINNTSVGLYPHVDERLDVDADSLQRHMVVADGIPNPPRTHWIRDAETRGCRVMDGLAMLVNQGVIGIKYWTDRGRRRRDGHAKGAGKSALALI